MKVDRCRGRCRPKACRRVVVLVLVLSGHLLLLVVVTRPAADVWKVRNQYKASGAAISPHAIELRFFRPSRQSLSLAAKSISDQTPPPVARHNRIPKVPIAAVIATRAAPAPAPLREGIDAGISEASEPYVLPSGSMHDGGLQERLRKANSSYGMPRLPGSDTPVVGGLRLADPMSQGVGSVMRKAQRLFGVKDGHCIDVDVWRSLTPQQLSARHISPGEVDTIDEKYACNAPAGLHF